MKLKLSRSSELDEFYFEDLKAKEQKNSYKEALKTRSKLPAFKKQEEIVEIVENNNVILLSGDTGNFSNKILKIF